MPSWTTYKGLEVPDTATGDAGTNLKDDLEFLADRAPFFSSSDPTGSNDSTEGYMVGSQWFNTSNQILWICIDVSTSGAAKWRTLLKRIDNAIVLMPEAGVGGSDGRALQFDDVDNEPRGSNAVDLQRTRELSGQVASGDNSAIIAGENNGAFSSDSVVAGGKGNRAGGGAISAIGTGSPTVVTSSGHALNTGASVVIRGSNSTPSIDGSRTVTVTGADTFTVPVSVSAAGSTGNWAMDAPYISVLGGENNVALGTASNIAGGNGNFVSGYAAHAEGFNNSAWGQSAHVEGSGAFALGQVSHAEGTFTTAGDYSHAEGTATYAGVVSHAEGYGCHASSYYSHAEGYSSVASNRAAHAQGHFTTASAEYSHAAGNNSKAHLLAQWACASGGHDGNQGSAQTTITQLFRRTTNDTALELTADGETPSSINRFSIVDGQTLSCLINIVGRTEGGDTNDNVSFIRQVLIRREGSTTELVGSVQSIGTINPATWTDVDITADDTNDSLKIEVTGISDTNIRWMATVIASEVADAAI